MKRKYSSEEDSEILVKMAKIAEIEHVAENSMVVASGTDVSTSLGRHFSYQLSDKKAKSNLLKGAAREALEIDEKQKCTMLIFSVGSYLEAVIPIVTEWVKSKKNNTKKEDLHMVIDEVTPGYDDNKKHMETLVKFKVNEDNISVTCFNTTQKIKVEGRGYLGFGSKYLLPLLCEKIKSVSQQMDQYNKEVIAALSGKRKAVSRPMRSVKYKAMAKIPCTKCEISFVNNTQLNKHKRMMHTRGGNESNGSISFLPIVDDISLMEVTSECDNNGKKLQT